MLNSRSIHDLYPLALAEGEGVGTAYEYFAKRLLLADWLAGQPAPARILIAGLPEKYGASLDFVLLAQEMGSRLTVIDDRADALARLQQALTAVQWQNGRQQFAPQLLHTSNLAALAELAPVYDLVLSSEVMQRLAPDQQAGYYGRLIALAPQVALFTPNGDNGGHVSHSGLSGLRLEELETRVADGLESGRGTAMVTSLRTGYVDMPPFPPGIQRSDDQRTQAASGKLEAAAMWGLGLYARLERRLPAAWRKSGSHIVFALLRLSPR